MEQAQYAVALMCRPREPLFVQPEILCDRAEQTCAEAVELGEKAGEAGTEFGKLGGARHWRASLGQRMADLALATDMPRIP